MALAICGGIIASGNTNGLILVLIVAIGGYVAWQFLRPSNTHSVVDPLPSYEPIGQEVKAMYVALSIPIKHELRKDQGATAYEAVFEMAFTDLICRFAALDGPISPSAAKVFLDIFTVLHPRTHAGLLAEDAVALLEGNRQRHPESLKIPVQNSLLCTLAQRAGEPYANNLKELMYKVARQVALADGPLSPVKQAELEVLRSTSEATAQRQSTDAPEPSADSTTATIIQTELHPAQRRKQHPIVDPQLKSATGLVTIEFLEEKTKEVVESFEPLLQVALREAQQSSNARILLEQDIRAIIIRLGLSNGSISEYAAHLYLELFKVLHPDTFAQWGVHDALDVLQNSFDENRDFYLGHPTKPFTLVALEFTDAVHGTGATKAARGVLVTLFIIIGSFAASVDGKVSEAKSAEIARMKALFESAG